MIRRTTFTSSAGGASEETSTDVDAVHCPDVDAAGPADVGASTDMFVDRNAKDTQGCESDAAADATGSMATGAADEDGGSTLGFVNLSTNVAVGSTDVDAEAGGGDKASTFNASTIPCASGGGKVPYFDGWYMAEHGAERHTWILKSSSSVGKRTVPSPLTWMQRAQPSNPFEVTVGRR